MLNLTPQQVADYFHRSYTAVDGLWFMKAEQLLGFDKALDIDAEVWKVMPKIQARKLKEMGGQSQGIDALYECFTTKLAMERFQFVAHRDGSGNIEIRVNTCPWVQLLAKSNRQHLAGQIGKRICDTEYAVWAEEFGPGITMEFGDRICSGCAECVIRYQTAKEVPARQAADGRQAG
jgi:hypothetical protein